MSPTTTPTSWLESLPTEILQDICSHFCPHCQGKSLIPQFHLPFTVDHATDRDTTSANAEAVRDLCALSRVSRRPREVAQPILYHEFPSLELRRGRLEPYLRTVIARPDLAVAVKTSSVNLNIVMYLDASLALTIYLQGLEVLDTDVDKVWSSRCEDPLLPGLQEALQGFLFGYESDKGSTPAQSYIACAEILVLLLSLLPNVTTLVVDGACIGVSLSPSAFRAFGINSIKLKRLYASSLPRAIVDVAHDLDELMIGLRFEVRQEPKSRSISYCLSPEHELAEQGEENNPVPHALDRRYLERSFSFYKGPVQSFRFETHGIKPDTRLPRPSFHFLINFRTTLQSLHLDFHIDNTSGANNLCSRRKKDERHPWFASYQVVLQFLTRNSIEGSLPSPRYSQSIE
ncbi:hypothetical protein FBULB1_14007 [Fusarium bulbicola]|nr:hypothetical protein FBULB1_14007 [Fusarium bulbicola]